MPAIQSLVAGSVTPSDQGKVQGALTSLMSLTSIVAPLVFTAGLFSYFTSERAAFELPGAPFLLGALLCLIGTIETVRLFRRVPPASTAVRTGGGADSAEGPAPDAG